MRLELVTAPSIEPITLAEAKTYCRIDQNDDDTLITALIIAARRFSENYCNIAFINQSWKLTLDHKDWSSYKNCIDLSKGKIQEIENIKTYDLENEESIFASASYRLSGNRVVLNSGYSWPTLYREFDALEVNYIAGFGETAADVPDQIKLAIKMLVAHLYENREATVDPYGDIQKEMLPLGYNALLYSFRVFFL